MAKIHHAADEACGEHVVKLGLHVAESGDAEKERAGARAGDVAAGMHYDMASAVVIVDYYDVVVN